jgi:predicted permease
VLIMLGFWCFFAEVTHLKTNSKLIVTLFLPIRVFFTVRRAVRIKRVQIDIEISILSQSQSFNCGYRPILKRQFK